MKTTNNSTDRRWLVVDDEAVVMHLAAVFLHRLGVTNVQTCGSSADALRAFEAEPDAFECVLANRCLPGLDGHELARCIRERSSDTKIVLMSRGLWRLSDEEEHRLGVDAVVQKPFDAHDLKEAMHTAELRHPATRSGEIMLKAA
ncbi:MAG: response regulator [Verrucomicrobia bacterium]|nr:response regulator [Verrucomicrobiota bacterium]